MAGSTIEQPAATSTPPHKGRGRPRLGLGADGTSSPLGLTLKIIALGLLAAVAVWAALPLIRTENWFGLAILVAVTLFAFYVYLSPRQIPLKYLLRERSS
jgi:arabinogalactan oligomer / maltooligosaccharide transport system permease protein